VKFEARIRWEIISADSITKLMIICISIGAKVFNLEEGYELIKV
jgi:hypothetical protein